LPSSFEAGAERSLTITFDPKDEPDFRGRLSIELTGFSDFGIVLFEGRVDVTVVAGPIPQS
jgi:hypothetical protein